MAYTPQTWIDGDPGPEGQVTAARLNYMEAGIEGAHILGGGGSGGGRGQLLTVGSSQLPSAARNACDYVCTGSNDQIPINTALRRASRSADGFSGEGYGGVALVGPRFYIGNSTTGLGSGAITMYPSTALFGASWGTLITPQWSSNVTRGAIELLNSSTAHTLVSNLTIGTHNAVQFNGHGIYYTNDAPSTDTYEIKTGSDPFHRVENVLINLAGRSGIFITGSSGGARETQISHCLAWSAAERGFYIDSSDNQISDCRATGGGNFARFEIAGGNTKVANCKAYYSGNRTGTGSAADGFVISSSRCSIVGCDAQDNGRYGFNFTGIDVVASGLVADSNSRQVSNGAGYRIAARGVYSGLNAYDRAQTPASMQMTGFLFDTSAQVHVEGSAGVPSGGTHVSGSPGANSYVRIVRQGSTVYSVG